MYVKKLCLTVVICGLAILGQGYRAQADSPDVRLEGTWVVDVAFTDGSPSFKVLFTFMRGRTNDDGTLIDTNQFQFTPNPICTPDQGSWERRGSREFVATHLTFCFDQTSDPPGSPDGTAKIRDEIKLSRNGDVLTLRQYVEAFDNDGNVVFTGWATGRGTRLRVEAPPFGHN